MFNFIKKAGTVTSTAIVNSSASGHTQQYAINDRDDKDKQKQEKRERKHTKKRDRAHMSAEELLRLDEVRKSLKLRGRRKEKEKLPSGITADYTADFLARLEERHDKYENNTVTGHSQSVSRLPVGQQPPTSDSSEASLNSLVISSSVVDCASTQSHTIRALSPFQQDNAPPPALPPKPPKRGILKANRLALDSDNANTKDTTSISVDYVNMEEQTGGRQSTENVGDDDMITLQPNSTLGSPLHGSTVSASPTAESITDTNSPYVTPPFSYSPIGETQNSGLASYGDLVHNLPLPPITPIKLPNARTLTIKRQPPPRNDFGFSLRRAMVLERKFDSGSGTVKGDLLSLRDRANAINMRAVIFAEPGVSVQHQNDSGLLPGDQLLEVNGISVEGKSRETIIDMIKASGECVVLKVQPVAELSELGRRYTCDGSEVILDDSNIKCGTLRRSGSKRFNKSSQAKAENDLEKEKQWLEMEHVWLVNRNGFATARRVISSQVKDKQHMVAECGDGVPVKMRLNDSDVILTVDENDLEIANPPQFDRVEDLATLRHLNESSILHTLRQRYASNLIHTYAGMGSNLIVVNPMAPLAIYSEKVVAMFKGCKSEDMPPHIYSMAQSCYHSMLTTRRDQSLVFLGRSGSGKTTNFRHAIHYLINASPTPASQSMSSSSSNAVRIQGIPVDRLSAVWTVIEQFGNCTTTSNTNATRFAHIFTLDYDQSGQLTSGHIQMLLLQKQNWNRSKFQIMDTFVKGLRDTKLRAEFMLPLLSDEDDQYVHRTRNDHIHLTKVQHSFEVLGVTASETMAIYHVLAAIYHLDLIGSSILSRNSSESASGNHLLKIQRTQKIVQLLGMRALDDLVCLLMERKSSFAHQQLTLFSDDDDDDNSDVVTSKNQQHRPSHTDNGDTAIVNEFVSALYGELVACIVGLINRSLLPMNANSMSIGGSTGASIMVVDSPGLSSGSTLDDLSYNYLQERLQLLFHQTNVTGVLNRYRQEAIENVFIDSSYDHHKESVDHSRHMVDLFDRTVASCVLQASQNDLKSMITGGDNMAGDAQKKGLWWMLDEEATICLSPVISNSATVATPNRNSNCKEKRALARDLPRVLSGTRRFVDRLCNPHNMQQQRIGTPLLGNKLHMSSTSLASSDCDTNITLVSRCGSKNQFVLQHLNGTFPVTYTPTDWLRQCKDSGMGRWAATVLQDSSRSDIGQLYASVRGLGGSNFCGAAFIGLDGSQSLRRASGIRRNLAASNVAMKRKSICLQTKFTVDALVELLRRTKMRFVYCFCAHDISDNPLDACDNNERIDECTLSDPLLNVPLLRSQLRGSQMLDVIRIFKQGYPHSIGLAEFRRRFRLLSHAGSLSSVDRKTSIKTQQPTTTTILDEQKAVQDLLLNMDLDMSSYRIGITQLFFRSGILSQLESQRDERLTGMVVKLQAHCRGYLARRRLAQRKLQDVAMRCVQRNVRKFMLVRNWPWWRLFVRIAPLLNVHRTEEQLKIKSEELDMLKSKLEKIESERTYLKHENEKLEAKLSEMTADLVDEHSTSTLATERLDVETSERLKLERELYEMQHKNKELQQHSDRLEMELLHTRSDLNGLDSDQGDDEFSEITDSGGNKLTNPYKVKYDRAMRELGFTKRRLQQQHEDDLEQLIGLKKQLEGKLADAYEEVEEQRQVVAQWKRKAQKLGGEMNDMRILLEEQTARNNQLEKRQRKFDIELGQMREELKKERQNRERLQRERELWMAEKYGLEAKIDDVKAELDLKEEQMQSVQREYNEVICSGRTEEEMGLLRRQKTDLERKVSDQEEELDELSGQVQLLEQHKVRLEMTLESMRKDAKKEALQKDDELEEIRANWQKKVKFLEQQLDSEHEQRTTLLREKHELERRLGELLDHERHKNSVDEQNLNKIRRDLKRTKILLKDCQCQLERSQKSEHSTRLLVRQLRHQLDDVDSARAHQTQCKHKVEAELADVQTQLDELIRAKQDSEHRIAQLTRENAGLILQLDDTEDELNELMRKYNLTVQQMSADQTAYQQQTQQLNELELEKSQLAEQVADLTNKLNQIELESGSSGVSSGSNSIMAELRVKEMESKLSLEQTHRTRAESQLNRLKETIDRLQTEMSQMNAREQSHNDSIRRLERQCKDQKEELGKCTQRESDWAMKKRELEKDAERQRTELVQCRQDLKLAQKRIQDLQMAIEHDLEEEEEQEEDDDDDEDDADGFDNQSDNERDDDDDVLLDSDELEVEEHITSSNRSRSYKRDKSNTTSSISSKRATTS